MIEGRVEKMDEVTSSQQEADLRLPSSREKVEEEEELNNNNILPNLQVKVEEEDDEAEEKEDMEEEEEERRRMGYGMTPMETATLLLLSRIAMFNKVGESLTSPPSVSHSFVLDFYSVF